MQTSRVTVKGQVTIPKEVREATGIGPSDCVEFTPLGEGKALVTVCNKPASVIFGILKNEPRGYQGTVSLEEMEETIREERLKAGMKGLEE